VLGSAQICGDDPVGMHATRYNKATQLYNAAAVKGVPANMHVRIIGFMQG
jgi:hypothetical protein